MAEFVGENDDVENHHDDENQQGDLQNGGESGHEPVWWRELSVAGPSRKSLNPKISRKNRQFPESRRFRLIGQAQPPLPRHLAARL
jgi:hypothetical protein